MEFKNRTLRLDENQAEELEGMSVEYPYVYHYADLGVTTVPWHWHEELEFDYVTEGVMELSTVNQTVRLTAGEGVFTNANVMVTMKALPGEKPAVFDSQLFHPVFLGGHFKSIFMTKYLEPVLQNKNLEILVLRRTTRRQSRMLDLLQRVAALQAEADSEFQTRNLLSEIWLLLLEEIRESAYVKKPIQPARQERLQAMLTYIQQHYQEKISLEEIAGAAAVGGREALRCFRSCIGKTPFEYLLEYRIEMSRRLLKNTDLPVMEIAERTGFSSAAYYGKAFREHCGLTPGAYRRQTLEKP